MAAKYSDEEIIKLLEERKLLPADYKARIQLRDKRGHKESFLDVSGADGNEFRLILRQNIFNVLDFSIILAIVIPDSNQLFRLRRYNGKSHEHSNEIEKITFYDFHVHTATERYQELGAREDTFAEPSGNFNDYHSALRSMFDECGFELPNDPQQQLFGEGEI